MGSGTTAKVAMKLNRKFIGFEISKEYHELAEKRIKMNVDLFCGDYC
jgi:DNA modification methylase